MNPVGTDIVADKEFIWELCSCGLCRVGSCAVIFLRHHAQLQHLGITVFGQFLVSMLHVGSVQASLVLTPTASSVTSGLGGGPCCRPLIKLAIGLLPLVMCHPNGA